MKGAKNKSIALMKPTKESDGQGGWKTIYVTVSNVWAEIKKPRLRTAESTGSIVSELFYEIIIRKRTDITKGWRIEYGEKIFSVEHPPCDFERNDIVLICKEAVK
jgi:SPP1 family predicted phage head-tail adaptor